VPKQLVGAVYDVDDHAALCRSAEGVSEVGGFPSAYRGVWHSL
jgi:hypothetical protein